MIAESLAEMDAKYIAGRLALSKFHFRRNLLVSNVSWGLLPWEADIISMSKSGYLTEIEIKVSIADLKRDQRKRKFSGAFSDSHALIESRWYAMPLGVWQHKDASASIPEMAGVLSITKPKHAWDDGVRVEREPIKNNEARPLNASEQFQLARLGVMRHWSMLSRKARKNDQSKEPTP